MPKLESTRVRRQDHRGKAPRRQRINGSSLVNVMNANANKGEAARKKGYGE